MRVDQDKEAFEPITIVLETKQEASILHEAIEVIYQDFSGEERILLIDLSNALSECDY